MRSILALSLLVTLYGSANAATMYHAHRRHTIVRSQPLISSDPASGFAYAPWAADPLPAGTVYKTV